MSAGNVQSSRGVTLVGGGSPKADDIRQLLAFAPDLVAIDGGANACREHGLVPLAVIGDFDSLSHETRAALPETEFFHVTEQDSTDFEKGLTRIDAPFVLATGVASARLDHTLAAFSTLVRQVGPPTLILGEDDVVFAAPSRLHMELEAGTRVSLFPMTKLTGRSTGLKWPIEGLSFDPLGRIGTSNEATGPVTLHFDAPGCLVIMPRAALAAVLAALTGSPAAPAG